VAVFIETHKTTDMAPSDAQHDYLINATLIASL